jgi:KaiC/GvpD/RAD55 family RecA-like ATPase
MAKQTVIEKILDDSRYDPNKQPKIEQIVFTIQNQNIGSRQNFITLTGLPKAGKSRFISAIVSSALLGAEIFSMKLRLDDEHYRILHIDTEQGDYDYYKNIDAMKNMAKLEHMPHYFHSWNMREHEPKVLIQAVDHLVKHLGNIGVVILDGVLDMLYSYNDEAESKALINHLKKWSKVADCLIICILHVGKTTGSTVGHFGAMSDRASQTVIEVKRNDIDKLTTYTLIPKQSRSADPSLMNPVEIYWNIQERQWMEAGHLNNIIKPKEKILPEDLHMDQHKATLRRIFDARGLQLKYNDLVTELYQAYNQPRRWCKACISWMLDVQLVVKNSDGLYTIHKQAKIKV